ncbi:MAG TPA: hypothetical protein VF669_21910 [Tepidisphaeraceae bacterium]|jgi:pimeloyl-ACP methyl ester carboxylesterase
MRLLIFVPLLGILWGCTATPKVVDAPTIALSVPQARQELRKIAEHPKPLERPLVILNGYLDPGLGGLAVGSFIREHVSGGRIITVSFMWCSSFEACRQRVIEAVDAALPNDDPEQTAEVDVIGLSMGGLVGRYAAAGVPNARRLNVRNLFTVSSPHQGATRAEALPPITQMQVDMRPQSKFLRRLSEWDRGVQYHLFPYSRLNDRVVGAQYAAPPGRRAVVVPNEPFQPAHVGAATDPRILADVLRHLRRERPLVSGHS